MWHWILKQAWNWRSLFNVFKANIWYKLDIVLIFPAQFSFRVNRKLGKMFGGGAFQSLRYRTAMMCNPIRFQRKNVPLLPWLRATEQDTKRHVFNREHNSCLSSPVENIKNRREKELSPLSSLCVVGAQLNKCATWGSHIDPNLYLPTRIKSRPFAAFVLELFCLAFGVCQKLLPFMFSLPDPSNAQVKQKWEKDDLRVIVSRAPSSF